MKSASSQSDDGGDDVPKTQGEYIKITAKDRSTVGEYVLVYAGHLRIQLARVKVVPAILPAFAHLHPTCMRIHVSTLNNTW